METLLIFLSFRSQQENDRVIHKVKHQILQNAPNRSLWHKLYHIHGLGGLCQMMVSTSGAGITSKLNFIRYCKLLEDKKYFEYITFCDKVFMLHNVQNEEVVECVKVFNSCFFMKFSSNFFLFC